MNILKSYLTNKNIFIIIFVITVFLVVTIAGMYYFRKNAYAKSSYTLSLLTTVSNLSVGNEFIVTVRTTNLDSNEAPQAGIQYDGRKLEYVALTQGDAGIVSKGDLTPEGNNQRIVITGVAGSTGDHELARVSFRIKDFAQATNANGKGAAQLCTLIDPSQFGSITTPTITASTLSPTPTSSLSSGTPVAGNFDEAEEKRLFDRMNATHIVVGNSSSDDTFTSFNYPAYVYNASLHQAARKLAVAVSQNDFEKCVTDTADSKVYTSNDPSSEYYWKKDPVGQWFDVERNSKPYLHTDLDGGNLQNRLSEFGYPPSSIMAEGVLCRYHDDAFFYLPKWWMRDPRYTDLAVARLNSAKGFVIVMLFGKPN